MSVMRDIIDDLVTSGKVDAEWDGIDRFHQHTGRADAEWDAYDTRHPDSGDDDFEMENIADLEAAKELQFPPPPTPPKKDVYTDQCVWTSSCPNIPGNTSQRNDPYDPGYMKYQVNTRECDEAGVELEDLKMPSLAEHCPQLEHVVNMAAVLLRPEPYHKFDGETYWFQDWKLGYAGKPKEHSRIIDYKAEQEKAKSRWGTGNRWCPEKKPPLLDAMQKWKGRLIHSVKVLMKANDEQQVSNLMALDELALTDLRTLFMRNVRESPIARSILQRAHRIARNEVADTDAKDWDVPYSQLGDLFTVDMHLMAVIHHIDDYMWMSYESSARPSFHGVHL